MAADGLRNFDLWNVAHVAAASVDNSKTLNPIPEGTSSRVQPRIQHLFHIELYVNSHCCRTWVLQFRIGRGMLPDINCLSVHTVLKHFGSEPSMHPNLNRLSLLTWSQSAYVSMIAAIQTPGLAVASVVM